MTRRRLSVRTIREELRRKWRAGLSDRQMGASCKVGVISDN